MRNRVIAIAAALAFVALSAGAAHAGPILDQSYVPSSNSTGSIHDFPVDWSQTFTVGATGTLTDVQVLVAAKSATTGDLFVDIRKTSGGTPAEADSGSDVLFSTSFSASDVGTSFTFFNIDLGSDAFSVSNGDLLAIVLRSDETDQTNSYSWKGDGTSGYSGGEAFDRIGSSGTWGDAFLEDLGFKTFVDSSANPVPEPSTIVLLGLGAAGFLLLRRRRG